MKSICLIGYSGHAYVVYDCFFSQGRIVAAYTETSENVLNPYGLNYLGNENDVLEDLRGYDYFVAIGDNAIRKKITHSLSKLGSPVTALHKTAILSHTVHCGDGVLFGPRAIVNSFVQIGDGAILNSGCIVEHECTLGKYVHLAPGAVLCGNVTVGDGSFIGANAVVKPGIVIGSNVIIGAGAVVVTDVPDNVTWVGNPAKKIG